LSQLELYNQRGLPAIIEQGRNLVQLTRDFMTIKAASVAPEAVAPPSPPPAPEDEPAEPTPVTADDEEIVDDDDDFDDET